MFAATMALVWFGYVATREWRSGTNLLLERRANEALALVRAALSADMKGAWITAIVPFNTTDPGRGSAVQHVPGLRARLRAVPVSRVLRAVEARPGGTKGPPTRSTARIARRRGRRGPRRTIRSRWCWSAIRPRWPDSSRPSGSMRRRRRRSSCWSGQSTGRPTRSSRTRSSRPARPTHSWDSWPSRSMSGGCTRSISIRWWNRSRRSAGAWAASRLRCPTTRAGS